MPKKNTEVANVADSALLADLASQFPTEQGFERVYLPRFSMFSKDQVEGEGKEMEVISEAGTFYTEKQSDDVDPETGEKPFVKTEIGKTVEGIIIYKRKQLRMYDEPNSSYISSPIYDSEDEELPLWQNKVEIARATPKDLQAMYPGVTAKGKPKSNLEENIILYVLIDGELHQMNLRGSSMYNYKTYAKKVAPPTVVTTFGAERMEKGTNVWRATTFSVSRPITQEEGLDIVEKVTGIRDALAQEREFFANRDES